MKDRPDETQRLAEIYAEELVGNEICCPSQEECEQLALFSESAYRRIRRAIERVKSGKSHVFVEEED